MSEIWTKKYIGLHISTHYSCPVLMKLYFSWYAFETFSNIKFHETPSSGSWVGTRGQTDMTKLIIAFHNFANMPKNTWLTRIKDQNYFLFHHLKIKSHLIIIYTVGIFLKIEDSEWGSSYIWVNTVCDMKLLSASFSLMSIYTS